MMKPHTQRRIVIAVGILVGLAMVITMVVAPATGL